jgi:hypothetical protein
MPAHPQNVSATRSARRIGLGLFAASLVVAGLLPQAEAASKPAPPAATGGVAADGGVRARTLSAAAVTTGNNVRARMMRYASARGTQYTYATYVDPASGRTVLETDAPSAVVSSIVGADKANVVVHRTTVRTAFSRKSDSAPFYGGGGIGTPLGTCSAGYAVQNSAGTRFMVTAGHCGNNGGAVTTELGGVAYGTIQGNGGPSRDMELIGGKSYAGRIFGGGVDSSTNYRVAGASDPVVGFTNYCHSGRTTGENCGHTVTSVTGTVCTTFGCQSPVIVFTGGVQPQKGDSGDPFYVGSSDPANTDKFIRGHVIAISGTTTGYAELYSRVSSFYGVTAVIG